MTPYLYNTNKTKTNCGNNATRLPRKPQDLHHPHNLQHLPAPCWTLDASCIFLQPIYTTWQNRKNWGRVYCYNIQSFIALWTVSTSHSPVSATQLLVVQELSSTQVGPKTNLSRDWQNLQLTSSTPGESARPKPRKHTSTSHWKTWSTSNSAHQRETNPSAL